MHELRVLSLANGVTGAMNAAALSLHASGRAYARVAETINKCGVKQMDRRDRQPSLARAANGPASAS